MIPWQLGVQQNAAMYSHAHAWMQTFDCCCRCWNMHSIPVMSVFVLFWRARVNAPIQLSTSWRAADARQANIVTDSSAINPKVCHITPHTPLSFGKHQCWLGTSTACHATSNRSALTQNESTSQRAVWSSQFTRFIPVMIMQLNLPLLNMIS